jgi:alanyl-tRNA synthetase
LNFFEQKQHVVIPRASLVPKNDKTTLFTGSGMQALLPYLLGKQHPLGCRLTNSQACLRSQDIEDVGDNRHTTFFEMLGNWSLGDYSKQEQIRWFFEFLVDEIGLDPAKIYVTVFMGNVEYNIPRDEESALLWQKLFDERGIEAKIVSVGSKEDGDKRGIFPGERIFYYDDGENWWSRNGGIKTTPIGDPCGPDSEVFYDYGQESCTPCYEGLSHPASDDGRFMEIGNQVFMQYIRQEDGSFAQLDKPNVDFGGGLERITAASNGDPDVYNINLLKPIIDLLEKITGKDYQSHKRSMRIIADHMRGACFLILDGVRPGNKEQGYVLRRLVRRAVRFGLDLGITDDLQKLVPVIVSLYPELISNYVEISEVLNQEEIKCRKQLTKGLSRLNKFIGSTVTGKDLFLLSDTVGLPLDISLEEINKINQSSTDQLLITLTENWKEEYDSLLLQQQERSRSRK